MGLLLKNKTEALYQEYVKNLPEDTMKTINEATDRLIETKIGQTCLQVGDKIPDFTLPDAYGNSVNISSVLKEKVVILSFYRGGWCTFCNLELKALQEKYSEIKSEGAELVAITPQKPDGTRETLEELELNYPILTDQSNRISRKFGLTFEVDKTLKPIYENVIGLDICAENGDTSYTLPITATYIVNKNKEILAANTDPNFVNRFEPEDIIKFIRNL